MMRRYRQNLGLPGVSVGGGVGGEEVGCRLLAPGEDLLRMQPRDELRVSRRLMQVGPWG